MEEKKALRQARRRAARGDDGEPVTGTRTAAGVGHFLLKLGEGATPGTPFQVWVPPAEREAGIHDTDARLRAADEDRAKEFAA